MAISLAIIHEIIYLCVSWNYIFHELLFESIFEKKVKDFLCIEAHLVNVANPIFFW